MMNLKSLLLQVDTSNVLDRRYKLTLFAPTDWDDSQTDLAHLGGAAPGAAKSGGDKLWEDNWDDDDVEEDFSLQLRCVSELSALRFYACESDQHIIRRSELEKTKKAKEVSGENMQT
jgi:26 proteasome complex subunit DSS1